MNSAVTSAAKSFAMLKRYEISALACTLNLQCVRNVNGLVRIAIHGAPRSGTSWLGEIFNSSPDTVYKFQPLFSYAFKDYLSPNSTLEEIELFFSLLETKTDSFLDQTERRLRKELPEFDKAIPTHIVYKEVRYHHVLNNLLGMSQDLFLIGIIRNPLSVIHSWLNAPREFRADEGWNVADEWCEAPSKNLNRREEFFGFKKWKETASIFLDLECRLPERVKIIRYETLLQDPDRVTRNLFKFCGIPMSTQTSEFLKQSRKRVRPGTYAVYRSEDTSNKWEGNLDVSIVQEIVDDLSGTNLECFLNKTVI